MITLVVGTNTLGTYQEAEDYFEASPNAATWCALTATVKKQNLVGAYRAMTQMKWDGDKTVSSQTAPFPRTGLVDIDEVAIDSVAIPDIAKFGQFELALYFSANGGFVSQATGQIKEVQSGTAKVKYFQTSPGTSNVASFPEEALQYFNVLSSSSNEISVPYASGVDDCSSFDDISYDTY